MKSSVMRRASVVALPVLVTAWATAASAQAPVTPETPATAPATTAAPAPVVAPVAPTVAPSVAPPNAAPAAAPTAKWYDGVKVEGFVDAYASANFNFPRPQSTSALGTPNPGRAFDVSNGAALHWAGVNLSVAPAPVGGTVGLRFGPGALIYNSNEGSAGLQFVKQAFVSWKPGNGAVTLDFGKFDTWIGAEVADSQYNMNYTRSVLFFTQPVFSTGLRLDYAVNDMFDIKLYAVNGNSRTIDNNAAKTFGATIGIIPAKDMAIYLNYMGGPEQDELVSDTTMGVTTTSFNTDYNKHWRHMGDLVADLHFDKARVLINADYVSDYVGADKHSLYGANLTLGYAVNDQFAVALRGGYTVDPDGALLAGSFGAPAGSKASVFDGTLTLAATPTPNLIIKLEPRIDSVSSDASGFSGGFPKGYGDSPSKTMFTTTLGIVATTN
jgi:hypothetical protein